MFVCTSGGQMSTQVSILRSPSHFFLWNRVSISLNLEFADWLPGQGYLGILLSRSSVEFTMHAALWDVFYLGARS